MIRKGRKDNKEDNEKKEIRVVEHRSSQGTKGEGADVQKEGAGSSDEKTAEEQVTSEKTADADSKGETSASDLQAKAEEYLSHLQRLQAEFENYRKRMIRERDESWRRARGDLILSFIPFIDDLRRLLRAPVQSSDTKKLVEGVELIERNIMDFLEKEGLEEIEALGKTFDPTLHEALEVQVVDDEKKDGLIAEVLIRGYKYKDVLLRPSGVKVYKFAKKEEPEEEKSEEEASSDD
ncbi:MAG: nucleotide exchange factor GrpE [Candidatus Glassbacteria bacterium]